MGCGEQREGQGQGDHSPSVHEGVQVEIEVYTQALSAGALWFRSPGVFLRFCAKFVLWHILESVSYESLHFRADFMAVRLHR